MSNSLSICLSIYRHRITHFSIAVTFSMTTVYINIKYNKTCLPAVQILALCILGQCCPIYTIFMFIIILLIERHIYYVISISVLHNIQWRCYSSSTFTGSTNNGMRSLASGCYVMCVCVRACVRAFWKPAAVISTLATRKRDLVHGISTRMCSSLASGGNMNWRLCPVQPIYSVTAVIGVQNCYLSKNSVRIPRSLKTPVRFVFI